jgi:hypothetical protein
MGVHHSGGSARMPASELSAASTSSIFSSHTPLDLVQKRLSIDGMIIACPRFVQFSTPLLVWDSSIPSEREFTTHVDVCRTRATDKAAFMQDH